jgi:hypothetical protein
VQSQFHQALPNPMAQRLFPGALDAGSLDRLADHIADFSLGGIRDAARVRA